MSLAGTNEKKFSSFLEEKINVPLDGKKSFKSNKRSVSISVDNSLVVDDWLIMFEIDSGNMAKLLAGQYTLLNILAKDEDKRLFFVIIHYYKNYNSDRTIKNLNLINDTLFENSGIPFKVFSKQEFSLYLEECATKKDLLTKLIKVQIND